MAPRVNHTGVVHKSHYLSSVRLRLKIQPHGIHLQLLQLLWTCPNVLRCSSVPFCGEDAAVTKDSLQQMAMTKELFQNALCPKKIQLRNLAQAINCFSNSHLTLKKKKKHVWVTHGIQSALYSSSYCVTSSASHPCESVEDNVTKTWFPMQTIVRCW